MERAKLRRKKECITVSRKLKKEEHLDTVELDIMSKGEIPAFYPVQVSHSVLGTGLQFRFLSAPTLAERLSQEIDFGHFCTLMLDLVQTVRLCEARGIKVGNLDLRAECIFCESDHLRLLYWPIISSLDSATDIPQVFKTLGDSYRYCADDERYAQSYLAYFKTRMRFDIIHFQKALQKLRDDWHNDNDRRKDGAVPTEEPASFAIFARSGGGTIYVDNFPATFGRDPDACDHLFPDDLMVSRVHMSLFNRAGRIYVYDNRSRNGTVVNGSRIASGCETEILPGDVIQFGKQELIFVSKEDERAGMDI